MNDLQRLLDAVREWQRSPYGDWGADAKLSHALDALGDVEIVEGEVRHRCTKDGAILSRHVTGPEVNASGWKPLAQVLVIRKKEKKDE